MWKPTRTANGMYEFKHEKNGLTLLLVPKPGLKVTTANITYHVGSRNEGLGVTGSTHYLEHGMFKGSKHFNKKLKNGMWKLEELGAYMNATTYTDRTNYFSVIDTDMLCAVIPREGDRMEQPLLDPIELKHEMTVVRNEYERGENNDFEILQKRVVAQAFMAHPYHHSTIGWKSDIENVTSEALRKFHDTFYRPDNATYSFVGNFDSQEVMDMVDQSFGKIKNPEFPVPAMYTVEPPQLGQRRVTVHHPTNCALMCMAFKAPNGLHKDAIILKTLSHIISNGPQSLATPFKENTSNKLHDVMASWQRMKDPYLFSIWATTNVGTQEALEEAEKIVLEIVDLCKTKNMDESLKRAKQYIRNNWTNKMVGTRAVAAEINEAIARGDAFDVHRREEILDSITAKDVQVCDNKYFELKQSTVGWLLNGKPSKAISTDHYAKLQTQKFNASDIPSYTTTDGSLEFKDTPQMQYDSLKSDINVSLQMPDTSAKGYVTRKILSEIITRGFKVSSRECSKKELYEYMSQKNIKRQIINGLDALHIQASIPSNDKTVKTALGLISHEITNPIMNAKDFNYLKSKWCAELRGSRNNVKTQSKVQFSQCLFKEGDANYKYSVDQIVPALLNLKYNDIVYAHNELTSAPRVVTLLSKDEISHAFVKNKGDYVISKDYTPSVRAKPFSNNLQIPGKTSVMLKYGMVCQHSDPLELAVGVLGNGFSGRLMKIVRDQKGLTYGVNARVRPRKGCYVFEVTGTFSPKLLEKGIEATEEVIKQWMADELTMDEVNVQRNEKLYSRNVQFDSPGALSNAIHFNKLQYGNTERLNNFHNRLNAVTVQQVNEAKKQITFDKLAVVKVGTF